MTAVLIARELLLTCPPGVLIDRATPRVHGGKRYTGSRVCSQAVSAAHPGCTIGHLAYARVLAALTLAVYGYAESAGLIGAVIEGLALGPLRDGVLALARAIRFGLFERASLARVHCTALSHFIRSSRLVSELWRTRTRCEDHCQDRCRHHPAEEG